MVAQSGGGEFWRDLKPIEQGFRPGEAHTLVAYESEEPMRVTFNVRGPLIWLDENGQPTGYFDVFDYITLCKDHYERAGIGASYIEGLFR
jgi:2,4'-dihydroxyacetophenone dioxygenase